MKVQALGVAANDIQKLRDAGICTVEAVVHMPKREFAAIKGMSDEKHTRIKQAGKSCLMLSSLHRAEDLYLRGCIECTKVNHFLTQPRRLYPLDLQAPQHTWQYGGKLFASARAAKQLTPY